MLVDTHCHLNMMVKKDFDVLLDLSLMPKVQKIVDDAAKNKVDRIINVGTSLIESKNSFLIAQHIPTVYATIGIHPNDCTSEWKKDFEELKKMITHEKVVGIGETGIDRHYPDFDLERQTDAFRAQIELALEHKKALVIHSRDAYDETLRVLEEYNKEGIRGVMHCFSYDQNFADNAIEWGFVIGIGGTITYPKNEEFRKVAQTIQLENIVLETDAPFLPIQSMRGEKNHPKYIKEIAEFLGDLRKITFEEIARETTKNAMKLFAQKE